MNQPTFNLLDEPWIPCVDMHGRVQELGLKETLIRAHELRGVAGDTPVITAAIYRLLLAVIYRAMGPPQDDEHWGEVWASGRWDEATLQDYFDRWHDRFDLFHPRLPFYQWNTESAVEKTAKRLLLEYADNMPTLFFHLTKETEFSLSPAEAIRELLVIQTFAPPGLGGLRPSSSFNSPWTSGIIFLAEGKNLFETLALNWMELSALKRFPNYEDDKPVWEFDDPLKPDRNVPLGITDYLTWPSRSIRLSPVMDNDHVVVEKITVGPGLKLSKSFIDPFKAYREQDKMLKTMKFMEYRSLWRDSVTILNLKKKKGTHGFYALSWIAELVEYETLEMDYSFLLMALGMAAGRIDSEPKASSAKLHFYREEHLPVPSSYLQEDALVDKLQEALVLAENVHTALKRAVSRLATLIIAPTADQPDGRKPDKKDVNNLMAHWAVGRHYWAQLEPAFYELLLTLPEDHNEALAAWWRTLRSVAEEAFSQAERAAPDDARGLRAAVRARGQLYGALKKIDPFPTQEVNHVAT